MTSKLLTRNIVIKSYLQISYANDEKSYIYFKIYLKLKPYFYSIAISLKSTIRCTNAYKIAKCFKTSMTSKNKYNRNPFH